MYRRLFSGHNVSLAGRVDQVHALLLLLTGDWRHARGQVGASRHHFPKNTHLDNFTSPPRLQKNRILVVVGGGRGGGGGGEKNQQADNNNTVLARRGGGEGTVSLQFSPDNLADF